MNVKVEKQIGSEVLSFETGKLAKQAASCVIVKYGETVVLNAVATGPARPGTDFFPLTCDYRERTSAAGKFPGGFIKREGRPSTKETLTARLIDRPIRPMFAKGFLDEVQCQAVVLSSDRQNDGDVLAMNGVATAVFASALPFPEPVSSIRIGRIDGELVALPSHDQLEESDLDLVVSGTESAVTMIEGFAREMPEAEMLEAIEFAHNVIKDICALQRELREKVAPTTMEFDAYNNSELLDRLKSNYYDQFLAAKQIPGKQDRAEAVANLRQKANDEIIPDPEADDAVTVSEFFHTWHDLEEMVVRNLIIEGTRSDGRDHKTLRDIECYIDVLPKRVHGSAVFQRGETQALITVTLGTSRDEQKVDGLFEEYSKKFMLDYNFPSFSVGECRPIRGPGRREIGHGALAERSVKPILPDPDSFPYTIRVISDILESNGSSSMASVCGATLGLMAAGVKITNPVAGISVGLVKQSDDNWVLLTDILGEEDHFGDMDFKIAGTQRGITGIQLDLKIRGISFEIIEATLKQSREARIDILRKMITAVPKPREGLSDFAPRLLKLEINPEKIGMLIGPGGKNIRQIQESTDTVIEVTDDGVVTIASNDGEMAERARSQVEACTASVQIGKIYDGTVSSITDFGAFVEILPGRDGLCHISELSDGYISDVGQVCDIGDEMKVKVIDVDNQDRVKLSRRAALQELGLEDEFAVDEQGEEDLGFEEEYEDDFDDRDERNERDWDRDRDGGRDGESREPRRGGRNRGRNRNDDNDGGRPPRRHSTRSGGGGGGNRGGRGGGGNRGGNRGGGNRGGGNRGNRGGGGGRYR